MILVRLLSIKFVTINEKLFNKNSYESDFEIFVISFLCKFSTQRFPPEPPQTLPGCEEQDEIRITIINVNALFIFFSFS